MWVIHVALVSVCVRKDAIRVPSTAEEFLETLEGARSHLDPESEMSGCRHRMCQESESGFPSKADLLPVTVVRTLQSC